jgi:hypothetical protein
VTVVAPAFGRLVLVVVLWLFAIIVWNVNSASPLAAVRGVFRMRGARALLLAAARFTVGAIAAFAAVLTIDASDPYLPANGLSLLAIATFLAALFVDLAIGEELRGLWSAKR